MSKEKTVGWVEMIKPVKSIEPRRGAVPVDQIIRKLQEIEETIQVCKKEVEFQKGIDPENRYFFEIENCLKNAEHLINEVENDYIDAQAQNLTEKEPRK